MTIFEAALHDALNSTRGPMISMARVKAAVAELQEAGLVPEPVRAPVCFIHPAPLVLQ